MKIGTSVWLRKSCRHATDSDQAKRKKPEADLLRAYFRAVALFTDKDRCMTNVLLAFFLLSAMF